MALGGSLDLLGDLFDRGFHQFLAYLVELCLRPPAVVETPLDAVLNDQAPAGLATPASVPLDARDKLLERTSRHAFGLRCHIQRFLAPA